MDVPDVLAFASTALLRHRLRSGLTLLGVAIGVTAVVTLTALGEGARRYVVDQFSTLGANLLVVLPGKTETTGGFPGFGGTPHDLTLADAEALSRGIRAVQVTPVSMGTESVSFRERSRQVPVVGTTGRFRTLHHLAMRAGRFLPRAGLRRGAPVVVLGLQVARELFGHARPLGRVVRVGGWRLRVIGVLAKRGTLLGMNMDDMVFVPVATGMRMFNRSSLFRIAIQANATAALASVKRKVLAILTERHGEEDVTCVTQKAVLGAFSSILAALTLAVAGIAAVSLTVAGVGVMNVMLVVVSERTAEVGLLKALGAGRREILAVFLAEAVLLSVAGGAVGLAGGWALVRLAGGLMPAFPVGAPPWAVVAVLALSLGVGVVFGVVPAIRATRLDPVRALARR